MVDKRMISRKVYGTDAFLSLSVRARDLYTYLQLAADDLGFVDSPIMVMRQTGSSRRDLNELIKAGFLLKKDDTLLLIAHWNTLNSIRPDRIQSQYSSLLPQLVEDVKAPVYQMADKRQTNDGQMTDTCPQNVRIGTDIDLDIVLEEKKQERKEEPPADKCPPESSEPIHVPRRFQEQDQGETWEQMKARVRASAERLGIAGGGIQA